MVVGVPLTTPVVALIDSPAGRPVAAHDVMVALGFESVAFIVSGLMATLTDEVLVPGEVTVTRSLTVQVKLTEPL